MCLVIAGIFGYLAFSFYQDGSITNAIINGVIALLFMILMIRNILKVKESKKKR